MSNAAKKNIAAPTVALVALAGFAIAAVVTVRKRQNLKNHPTADALVKLCTNSMEALERRVISLAG